MNRARPVPAGTGRAVARPHRQRRPIQPRQLPMGDAGAAGAEPSPQVVGMSAGEHDARCLVWGSNDPSDCTCDDEDGHAPPVRWSDSPTLRAAATRFACDDDRDEATS